MAADTSLTIYGMGHLVGASVGVLIAGVDMGDYTVAADGSVTVTYGSDASAKVTASYLASNFTTALGTEQDTTFTVYNGTAYVEVTVPVLVGLNYTATGQLPRPVLPEALYGGKGPSLGKMRRGHKYALDVEGAQKVSVGTSTSNLTAASMTDDGGLTPELALDSDEIFTGVIVQPLADGPSYDTKLMWRVTRPHRLSVSMAAVFQEGEE